MKNFLLAVLILVTAGMAYGQTKAPIPTPDPVPAVVLVLHSGAPHTYHVVIDDTVYTVTGVGPKVSGIYGCLFQVDAVNDKKGKLIHKTESIILSVNHFNVKPTETYTLNVTFSEKATPTPYTYDPVDGRRLLIYEVTDTPSLTIYKALTVDNKTGEETRFIATSESEPLPMGIYDFLIKGTALNVYHKSRGSSVTVVPLSIVSTEDK
jgi:hypothetical protein